MSWAEILRRRLGLKRAERCRACRAPIASTPTCGAMAHTLSSRESR